MTKRMFIMNLIRLLKQLFVSIKENCSMKKNCLIAKTSKLAYPIKNGIPIMLIEEAKKID